MERAQLQHLLAIARRGDEAVLLTHLSSGARLLIEGTERSGSLSFSPADMMLINAAIATRENGIIETAAGSVFIEFWAPPTRLVIVGAVHIAQSLSTMAVLSGYRVTIIDPRQYFIAEDRFPARGEDVTLIDQWPDEVLISAPPDRQTAVVTLTHDPKIDDLALQAALQSPAFYIGCLGSRRSHQKRLGRLMEAGFDEASLARLHGPVGLDIGALTPGEIAVSIMADIIATARAHRIKSRGCG